MEEEKGGRRLIFPMTVVDIGALGTVAERSTHEADWENGVVYDRDWV